MDIAIDEQEKKRAANLVWNGAGDYAFEVGFRVYDDRGRADLYWNSVIGVIHRLYDWDALDAFYSTLADSSHQELLESLFWITFESAAFEEETRTRAAFAELRREYAAKELRTLERFGVSEDADEELARVYLKAHLRRALNLPDGLTSPREREILESLENLRGRERSDTREKAQERKESAQEREPEGKRASDGGGELQSQKKPSAERVPENRNELEEGSDLNNSRASGENELSSRKTRAMLERLTAIFAEFFGYGKEHVRNRGLFSIFHNKKNAKSSGKKGGQPIRHLAFGYGEHESEYTEESFYRNLYGDEFTNHAIRDDETMMRYLGCYFGKSLYSLPELKRLRKDYCTGAHADARIYITRGEDVDTKGISGPALMYAIRKHDDAKAQEARNRKAYETREEFYREQTRSLVARIRNAIRMYLDEETVRAASGELDVGRIYRAVYLHDDRIFTKTWPADDGQITVDLLLDSSESQAFRQETVAAQGYMIAEALSKCHIPLRVWSFRSVNGFTVLCRHRDYNETDRNAELFRYFTTGANRDGLGIRVVSGFMKDNPAAHRLLIVLSDGRPNDAVKMRGSGGRTVDYTEDAADLDTASEVHKAEIEGISVMCVFTGDARNLDTIKKIYGSNFAYIRNLEDFARSVGNMIQTSIRLL